MVLALSRNRLLFASLMLCALLLVTAACEPGESYDIVNDTGEPVVLIVNGHEIDLPVGETASYFAAEGLVTDHWIVVDQSGDVLMEFQLTWDELIEQEFRIVVR